VPSSVRRIAASRRAVRLGAAAALGAVLIASLSGCTASVFVSSGDALAPAPAAAPAPSATRSTAAEYYLDTICPRNGATYAFDDVRASDDLGVLQRAATAAAIASQRAAVGLRQVHAPWPAGIRTDISRLALSLDQDVVTYERIADAPTVAAARAVPAPGTTSAGDAKVVIREALGLSTDLNAVDDCVGHYDGAPTPAAVAR